MLEFDGKYIPVSLENLLHPKHTALVIVDVQNDYCEKGGFSQKKGEYLSKGNEIIEKLHSLIEKAREVGVQVIYTQNTILPNHKSDSAARLRFLMKIHGLDDPRSLPPVVLEGSWGHQVVEEIKPKNGDIVVKKYRPSAFVGTNLDMVLRSNNTKTLLITGVATQVCVDSTARDALFHEYFVVIARDCVDSSAKDLHEAALKIMETYYDVLDSDQIIEIWNKNFKVEMT